MISGSSGITVPFWKAELVAVDSAVGGAGVGCCRVGGSVAGKSVGSLVSDRGTHAARIEFARSKLPVTDAINFNASRRDNLPS
jgi:hypothetical protein